MYGSYGSYSSMSSVTQPLDIAPNSYLAQSTPYQPSCAYPSWPQRDSLGSSQAERTSSYISDDDLLFDTEDDSHSFSSASSNASSSPFISEQEMLEQQREQAERQREAMRFIINEKERRRQAFKKSRARTSYNKKSQSPKNMTSITENSE